MVHSLQKHSLEMQEMDYLGPQFTGVAIPSVNHSQGVQPLETNTNLNPYPIGWLRGSVIRTSVCSWRTFPDLRLIHGSRVTTLWVRRPLWVNQLGQLSLPSFRDR